MKIINIEEELLSEGHPHPVKIDKLDEIYGRENCGLKIYDSLVVDKRYYIHDLVETAKIQNIFAHYGFAPRVYDVVKVLINGEVKYAQVVEVIEGERGAKNTKYEEARDKISQYALKRGFYNRDYDPSNFIDDKYVDFGGWKFPENYKEQVQELVGTPPYQNIPELGIDGPRENKERFDRYNLDDIFWGGKTVLDVGCNYGTLCHEVHRRGAKRVIGIDTPSMIDSASEITQYLGHFNVDMDPVTIQRDDASNLSRLDIKEFDVVFHLSVHKYFGLPQGVIDRCKNTLYLEIRNHEKVDEDCLDKNFKSVNKSEIYDDYGPRILYTCKK